MKKKITILGATGSIGRNSLDVVRANPESFEIVGLSAQKNYEQLEKLGREFPRARLAINEATSKSIITFSGPEAASELASKVQADIVINGIAGAAGLYPTAYNAADEVAVDAFFNNRLSFMDIFYVVLETLQNDWSGGDETIESIIDGDQRARRLAKKAVMSRLEASC